ncbi:MAG TPA: universal stress protein, partial [Xanthobacteraceae bacterium]
TDTEGPGPLVDSLAKTAGTFPIPVAIVPGHLSDEDLDSMS